MTRLAAVLVVLLLSACTPAQVREWGDTVGLDLTDADVAVLVVAGARDCVPGRDEPVYVECAVADAAARYRVDLGVLDRLVWCESRYDPDAVNPVSSATGLAQFTATTWGWLDQLGAPYTHLPRTHARANVFTAAWLIARPHLGGIGHWAACR